MKLSTILASTFIPLGLANVRVRWSFASAPATGLEDITFPMNIANAKHERGYYFVQQVDFDGIGGVGYIGFQPRPDRNEKPIFLAAFSFL
ncbi:hypothetical protein J3459_013573 [Metarhizium acridum]|nr:hypothetical protein J3459_013573 [Metarhizium acridum]